MAADNTFLVNMKVVGDISDARSNIEALQKSFSKIKLPDKIGDSLSKKIGEFYKEYEKYQKKISEGVKTQGDYNQVEKSLNRMRGLYQEIGKEADKVTKLDLAELIDTDTGDFKKVVDDIRKTIESINKVKVDPKGLTSAFDQIKSVTKNTKIVGKDGILGQLIGHLNTGEVDKAKQKLQELQAYAQKVAPRLTESGARAPGTLSTESYQSLVNALQIVSTAFDKAEAEADPFIQKLKELQAQLERDKVAASQDIVGDASKFKAQAKNVDSVTESLKRMHAEEFNFNREAQNIDRQIQSYFGLSQMIRKVGDIARDAFATVKELDKAMTQTAVVTNFSVGDMWDMLPTYTAQANQLGSTIKDVYEAATLYYQQGLNTNQAMGLANETLKMARIAGLGAAEATDMMTAALRGFNMEINQQSAQKINDIYSELAAITASDTAEIGSAMERTASIANSANMEFATTSAFLAQMIETTREAPENLGTAMKTIVARFQEMKQDPTKLIDSEGVAMDANKVDKALKTIGVNLMNTKGEFRDLDDVFLDISQRWDSLTQGQQRYIATIAAGSRQQSRFIAMMSNYERTMELVDAANNSAGASQRQFEKTLDSMEAKLNKLKNAWDQFTMGLMNNQIIKLGVDALTGFLTVTNKIINALSSLTGPFQGVTKSVLTLVSTLGMLNFGKKAARGLVMGGAAWFKSEKGGFLGNFAQGFKNGDIEAQASGTRSGITWSQAASKAINSNAGTLKQAMHTAFDFDQVGSPELIEQSLIGALQAIRDSSPLFGEEGQEAGDEFIEKFVNAVKNGESSINGALQQALDESKSDLNIEELGEAIQQGSRSSLDLDKMSTGFKDLTKTASSAGDSIRQFGYALQGTPLEGFGNTLIRIGNLMDSAARTAQTFGKNFSKAIEAAGNASGAGGKTSTFFKEMFPNLTKIIGLLWKIPLPLKIIMAVALAAGAIALKVAHDNKKALESASDAAAKASEAYDSAKQETSELADAIEQVKSNEDAFEGLVAGTAAFNEQLVTANEQIMELIKKYPMLIEEGKDYVTTDKNGLMHINQQGLDAVRDYQRQKQANASALSIIQTADLNTVETKQKVAQMRKVKGEETLEQYGQRQKEADLLEQQAQAQADMAKLSAVNMSLVDKEIHNREKVSAILADQYDARKEAVNLEGQSIHDLKQQYADFYGYKYDKSTKKITDIEGNEIEVDKATVKDAVKEMTVITSFEADGKSLDSMLNHIDNTFSDTLGDTFEDSGHLFSDILSNNIDVDDDLIKKVLENPEKIQDAVDSLSEKEIAAVLGVTTDAVAAAPDQYKDELTSKLTERATNIAETQAQTYTDLATMMAQTVGTSVIDGNGEVIAKISEEQKTAINEQLSKLTSEQKNMLSSIGTALQEGAGTDSMRTFIKQATDIYTSGAEKAVTDLDNIIQGVNWDSPTARLKAYNDMIKDGVDPSVQKLGKSLLDSTDSANLLGEAFEEFYDSTDFQEMAENMDKFVDSSGQLSASSIQEMAKECSSLNNLLDTGAISAGGVAAALNAMGSSGNITILDLNQNLLEFLSTANQLQDVLAEAHNLIENFDWGVDTGESKDFAVDSTKKWKELYEGGEFGNQQLENYAKFVLGQDRWNKELEKSGGNIEKALDSMSDEILKYSDGFDDAWNEMADSTAKKYQDFHWDDSTGDLIWETNGRTTEQLVEDLAKARGITQEWAKLMVEDFANYSYDFKTELAGNDFAAALEKGDYITSRTGGNDAVNVTRSEINTLAAAQNKTPEEIEELIRTTVDESGKQLNVLENVDANGQALLDETSIEQLNKDYSQQETNTKDQSWLSQYQAKDADNKPIQNTTELKSAISGAIADGFQADQATEMARAEAAKAFAEGVDVFYDGVKLNEEDLADSQAFADRIAEITDNARWNAVGEAIAQGYISYIKGNEDSSPANPSNDWGSAKDGTEKGPSEPMNWGTGADQEAALREEMRAKARENWSQLWQSIKEGFSGGTPVEDPKAEAIQQSRENWKSIWEGVKTAFSSAEGVEDPKIEAAEKAKENWKSIWENVKKVFSTTPDVDIDPKTNGGVQQQNGSGGTITTKTEGQVDVTYTGKIANSAELKASLEQQITSLLNSIASQQSKMTATATVNVKQGKLEKPKTQNATVNYTKGKQAKADNQSAKVDYTLGKQAPPQPKSTSVNYTLGSQANPSPKTVDISPHFVGTWEKTIKLNPSGARGINNNISTSPLPSFGSAAKGHYGTVGPKNKGGLTLTGEEGFEIAWLPSESKSMIVGASGPQLLNLPPDAVVYTHEQSKKIVKQKSIPMGSHAGKHVKKQDTKKTTPQSNPSTPPKTDPKDKNKDKDKDKEIKKIIVKAGKVSVYWENLARKVEATQRKMDSNAKSFENYLKKMKATLDLTGKSTSKGGGGGDAYIKSIKSYKTINKEQEKQAKKALNKLDKNKTTSISYEQTVKTKKKGDKKWKTSKETKKAKVKLSDYIKYNKDLDTYEIDQKALDRVGLGYTDKKGKKHKGNKKKAEAIKQEAEKQINDKLSKRNTARDNIEKADEALEKMGQDLYENFFKWKTELTKIWNITQQIENTTKKINRNQAYSELLEAQIASGKAKSNKQTLQSFKDNLVLQQQNLKKRQTSIAENRAAVKNAWSKADEQATINNITEKLRSNESKAKAKSDAISKATDQKKKAEAKKQNAEAKKKNALSVLSRASGLDAQINSINKRISNKKTSKEERNQLLHLRSSLMGQRSKLDTSKAQKDLAQANADLAKAKTELNKATTALKDANAMKGSSLNETEITAYKTQQKELQDQIKAINKAREFTTFTQHADGTIDIDFDTAAFEKAQQKGEIGTPMKEAIEEYIKGIQEAVDQLNEDYATYTQEATEFYSTLAELKDQWADSAAELVNISEESNKKQLEQAKKLSDSINQALKNLLDDVKRKLDQRRQQEDNAKTERDISKKQQRLAALQADTSGGHQVEIAQLQQEIAQSQQDYQRTLEDQLLERLQNQADEAARQREQQIALQEALLNSVSNIEQVNAWMSDPEAYYAQMKEAYRQANNYDEVTQAQQEKIDRDFETLYENITTNPEKQLATETSIAQIQTYLDEIKKYQEQLHNELGTPEESGGKELTTSAEEKAEAARKKQLEEEAALKKKQQEEEAAAKAREAAARKKQQEEEARAKENQKKQEIKDAEAWYKSNKDKNKKGASIGMLSSSKSQTKASDYYNFLMARGSKTNTGDKNWGKIGKDGYLKQVERGKTFGKSEYQVAKDLANTSALTWKEVLTAAKEAGRKGKTVKAWDKNAKADSAFRKAFESVYGKWSKFATGGLANYTGPAWLDGTPSKPELVLSAKDTQNFIALKDILSKAMSSAGAIDDSYNNNATYEININVDKITSDYDVDKMAERVKKIIVKDSSYRNVTQVRKLR